MDPLLYFIARMIIYHPNERVIYIVRNCSPYLRFFTFVCLSRIVLSVDSFKILMYSNYLCISITFKLIIFSRRCEQ